MKMESTSATVLTKQNQRRSLSAVKKKYQGRLLFASPYDTYWPELKKEAEGSFNELLLRTLKPIGKPPVKVTWSMMQNIPREQRREFRRKMQVEAHGENLEGQALRECMHFGVNAVTRGLNTSRVSAVLVAKDADPRLLISHILTLCSIKGVPVLVVPALRTISKEALGFSSLALAIKEDAKDNFQDLCCAVALHSKKIPVPEPLPSYKNALDHEPDKEIEEPPKQQNRIINISSDVYKYRSSKKERAFVPESEPKPSNDFLTLNVHTEDTEENKPGPHFKPLRLKRMAPNPYKIRKKQLKKLKRKHVQ